MTTDNIKQEIRDLFAKCGSGDYTPTAAEKEIINDTLDELFRSYNEPRTESGELRALLREEGELLILDFKRPITAIEMNREQGIKLADAIMAKIDAR